MTFLLYFGVNTIWYLHNHFMCAKLVALCAIATPSFLAISDLNNRYARRKDFNLQSKKIFSTRIAGGFVFRVLHAINRLKPRTKNPPMAGFKILMVAGGRI